MYRIDVHIKQNSKIREKHWSYNAIDIRIFENAVYILLSNNRVKAFNMDEVSNFKVHKLSKLSSKYAVKEITDLSNHLRISNKLLKKFKFEEFK